MTRTTSHLASATAAIVLTVLTFQQVLFVPDAPSPVAAVTLA